MRALILAPVLAFLAGPVTAQETAPTQVPTPPARPADLAPVSDVADGQASETVNGTPETVPTPEARPDVPAAEGIGGVDAEGEREDLTETETE
ncbi:hypothetical protein, partial [Limimaricola cinnabarinus]|uniref:hypothetical protein n=1 Tax=Limimaricola cinnabarinus TaxID=1125964 RepID=UPI0005EC8F08